MGSKGPAPVEPATARGWGNVQTETSHVMLPAVNAFRLPRAILVNRLTGNAGARIPFSRKAAIAAGLHL